MRYPAGTIHILIGCALAAFAALPAQATPAFTEAPSLQERVAKNELPPVAERLPATPRTVSGAQIGQYGGDLRVVMARARDTRMMTVYGYARLLAYDTNYQLVPDILESFEAEDNRVFTLRLRKGHKWSDGHPFTTEDFRYWWEDVANNSDLYPFGPPIYMKAMEHSPKVEILDETTIRFTWPAPNPTFPAILAGARPPFIYRPAHYLKQFHAKYADPGKLAAAVEERRMRNWAALHNSRDNMYDMDNPELPTLQPWQNTVRPPAQQFVFVRNPFFHRVDPNGQQLPYIDRVLMNIADTKLIPAKAGAGEADLQARNIFMSHFTFLKHAEAKEGFKTRLWKTSLGAKIAVYPNMHYKDPVWRNLFRNADFRHALSLAIDRDEINQVIYYGLATPANNTVLEESPLFRESYRERWTSFDPERAEQLLDSLGLDKRDRDDVRLLPDGRRLEIVVETAGEETEQTDALELIHDSWLDVGIKIYTRPSQREVFNHRIFAGETMMSVWSGVNNGLVTSEMSPAAFAPTDQTQYQWPKWGQYYQTEGQAGEPIDLAPAQELFRHYEAWIHAANEAEREHAWLRILEINAEQTFTIGIVCCTKQPVVVSNDLKNVPREGMYAWNPGGYFGVYLPDTFFFARAPVGAKSKY